MKDDIHQSDPSAPTASHPTWVRHYPTDGRVVPSRQAYWEKLRGFNIAFDRSAGLIELPLMSVDSTYLSADGPATHPASLFDPLGTVIIHLGSHPKALEALGKLHADVLGLAASLMKQRIIVTNVLQVDRQDQLHILLGTEFEFLFVTLRAYFDQLQFLIRVVVSARGGPELPATFSKLCRPDARGRYQLSDGLTEWYASQAEYFELVRTTRVGIEHHGASVPFVMLSPAGLAVFPDSVPWSRMPIWGDNATCGNPRLGSYWRAIGWTVGQALLAGETLASVLRTDYLSGVESLTDWDVFLCSAVIEELLVLPSYIDYPWRADAPGLDGFARRIEWPPE